MHGSLAAEEVVAEQKTTAHACVHAFQVVSLGKSLLPYLIDPLNSIDVILPPPYAPCQVLFLFFGGNVANLLFLRYKLRSTTLLKS